MTTTVDGLAQLLTLGGADLGRTAWREVTQDQVNEFASATGDHQWIHVDLARAAAGPFGGPIAHGYLTLSLVIPLLGELLEVSGVSMAVNYGLNRVRFPAPVPVGSQVRLAARVAAAEPAGPGAVQLTTDLTVEVNGGAKPACAAQGLYRYYA